MPFGPLPWGGVRQHGHVKDVCQLQLRKRSIGKQGKFARYWTELEFLTVVLQAGFDKNGAEKCANCLLQKYAGFSDAVLNFRIEKCENYSAGKTVGAIMQGIYSLILRLTYETFESKPVISHTSELVTYLHWALGMKNVEEFRVLFLDSANHLLADEVLSTGTVNHVPVYIRDVLERSLAAHATAVILVHNHPSGKVEPSDEDIEMTNRVNETMNLVGIQLHDHIIIGRCGWYSFRSAGMISPDYSQFGR